MANARKKTFRKKIQKRIKMTKFKATTTGYSTVNKMVAIAMGRNMERKVASFEFSSTNWFGLTYGSTVAGQAWNTNNLFPISPWGSFMNIQQGTAQNQRIGNEIKAVKATLKLHVYPLPYDLTYNSTPRPIIVQIIIYYDKLNPSILPTTMPNFFQNGSSSTDPNTLGLPVDILKSVNTDRYKVFSRRKIKVGYSAVTGTGNSATSQYHSNNDFNVFSTYSIDYTKYMNKRIKYNDNASEPITRNLLCAVMVMSADGTTVSTQRLCRLSGFMQIEYIDA